MKFTALLALLLAFTTPAYAAPSSVQLEHTKATLVSEDSVVNASPLHLAVFLEPLEGWHTYWENPGDAGMPTTLTWTLPPDFKAGDIDWPAPQHLAEGPLVTYAYKGTAFLPVDITVPVNALMGDYTFKVKAEWLVCKDICVPESTMLELTLPAGNNGAHTAAEPLFANHAEHHPQLAKTHGHFKVDGKQIILTIPYKANPGDLKDAQFTIREQNVMQYAGKQELVFKNDIIQLIIERADEMPEKTISGILTVNGTENFNVVFDEATTLPDAETPWFPVILLFALLGGLVLNLMPCVLPILSLKALSIAKKAGSSHEDVVRQGIAYTLGILITFTILAGILLSLRGAGESIGWGYQMQSPAFVAFLVYLLFMVGLSLSGLFHLPVLLGNVGGDVVNESSARGSFFTGVLATAVATPCTAPFMASAVGAALTMPPLQGLLVFEALGLGLALPFLLISLLPRLRRFLPKPGAWMDTFKQLLAFPMYASVIWLLWVLTLQTGAGGMVLALTGMLLAVVVIWMKSLFTDGSRTYTIVSLVLYALILLVSLPQFGHLEATPLSIHTEGGITSIPYSKATLDELRKQGKPVFVDATAAWCITCQVNARVALYTAATMKEFKDRGVVLMIADWTKRDDSITEFLSSFGFKGVPLCVFYPPNGKEPVIMPQILTEDTVIKTIKGD